MKLTVVKEDDAYANEGGQFQGYLPHCSANELIRKIGPPSKLDNMDKIDFEWIILDKDKNEMSTIYNWKDGPAYYGGPIVESDYEFEREWHIGGSSTYSIYMAYKLLNLKKEFDIRYTCVQCQKPVQDWTAPFPHFPIREYTFDEGAMEHRRLLVFCSLTHKELYNLNPIHLLDEKLICG